MLAQSNKDSSAPLLVHLVDGLLSEMERMTGQMALAETELKRLHAKVTIVEAELAKVKSHSAPERQAPPQKRFTSSWIHWTILRTCLRHPVSMFRKV